VFANGSGGSGLSARNRQTTRKMTMLFEYEVVLICGEFNFYFKKVYRSLDLERTVRYQRNVTVCVLLTDLKSV
jgi:hypothetical protein